LYNIFANAVFI